MVNRHRRSWRAALLKVRYLLRVYRERYCLSERVLGSLPEICKAAQPRMPLHPRAKVFLAWADSTCLPDLRTGSKVRPFSFQAYDFFIWYDTTSGGLWGVSVSSHHDCPEIWKHGWSRKIGRRGTEKKAWYFLWWWHPICMARIMLFSIMILWGRSAWMVRWDGQELMLGQIIWISLLSNFDWLVIWIWFLLDFAPLSEAFLDTFWASSLFMMIFGTRKGGKVWRKGDHRTLPCIISTKWQLK